MQQPPRSLLLPGTRVDAPIFGTESERFSLTDVFGPNFEGAAIRREVTLASEEVRRLIRRDYLYLSKMLHTLTRAREYKGIDHPALNRIEEQIDAKISAVRELITTRLLDLAKRFNAKPDAIVEVIHARPTVYEAPIASPHANAYLDLLFEADNFFSRAKAAWLQGLTKPQDHHGRMREIKKALYAIKMDVTVARTECFKMLNRMSAAMAPTDPEAASLRQDIKTTASQLLADANADVDVMNNLSVSEGHDLQAVAGAGEPTTPPADAGGGADPAATVGAAESKAAGGAAGEAAGDAPATPSKRRKPTAEAAAADAQS